MYNASREGENPFPWPPDGDQRPFRVLAKDCKPGLIN